MAKNHNQALITSREEMGRLALAEDRFTPYRWGPLQVKEKKDKPQPANDTEKKK